MRSAGRRGLLGLALVGLLGSSALGATILPPGETTFVDANGVPISGGTVSFFIPNTLTPKITWKDSAQTIPNTNPVVLDSAGRAVIYGTGVYRQILRDQAGNLVWDKATQGFGSGGQLINPTIFGGGSVGTCAGVYSIQNTSLAAITLVMPAAPSQGDQCQFLDSLGNSGSLPVTFSFGPFSLSSGQTKYVFSAPAGSVEFIFLGTAWGVE